MKRDLAIDCLRILACFLVVLIHSPLASENSNGIFLTMVSYIAAPSIGILFMVSGALLLPIKGDYFSFLKRRFSKIVCPTIFWAIVYLSIKSIKYNGDYSWYLRCLASIPFSVQGNGVLWFMYTLAGLYLIAPILSAWVRCAKKSEIELVLGFWGVTLCYPIISRYVIVDTTVFGTLYYFTGYAGYFLLGYYLNTYGKEIRQSFNIAVAVIALIGPILLVALKFFEIQFDFYTLFWNQSIFIVALCVVIWQNVKFIFAKLNVENGFAVDMIVKLSNLSFGIYLSHILIMREWLWNQDMIQSIQIYPIQSIIVAVATFSLSGLLSYVVLRLPVSKWVIGV